MRYSSNLIRHVFYKIISNNNIIFIYLFNLLKIIFYRWTPTPEAATIRFYNSQLKQRKVYVPDVINSNHKFDVSLDRTLLTTITKSECLCFNSRCTNLSSQSTEREKISTWDCRFGHPGCHSFCCLMHQSIPAAHRPPPPPLSVLGGGAFANFALPGGWAFANPRAIPKLLTCMRFPIRI